VNTCKTPGEDSISIVSVKSRIHSPVPQNLEQHIGWKITSRKLAKAIVIPVHKKGNIMKITEE
jgi:hypothetical protein